VIITSPTFDFQEDVFLAADIFRM